MCSLHIDRDYNAAKNIKRRGTATLPVGYGKVTPSERIPLVMTYGYDQVYSLNEEICDLDRG